MLGIWRRQVNVTGYVVDDGKAKTVAPCQAFPGHLVEVVVGDEVRSSTLYLDVDAAEHALQELLRTARGLPGLTRYIGPIPPPPG